MKQPPGGHAREGGMITNAQLNAQLVLPFEEAREARRRNSLRDRLKVLLEMDPNELNLIPLVEEFHVPAASARKYLKSRKFVEKASSCDKGDVEGKRRLLQELAGYRSVKIGAVDERRGYPGRKPLSEFTSEEIIRTYRNTLIAYKNYRDSFESRYL